MSTATPTRTPITRNLHGLVKICLDRLTTLVCAAAFWIAALLPLMILAGLTTGAANRYPSLLAGTLAMNAVCAIIGHSHTPR